MTVDFLNLKPHCQDAQVHLKYLVERAWQEWGTPRKTSLHKPQESLFAKLFKAGWEACLENKELFMWAGCKASSYKDNAKEAFCFRKKFPSEGCLISVPAGCSHCKFTEWNWETLYWLQWVKNKIQVDSLGWSRKSVVNVIQVSSLKVR